MKLVSDGFDDAADSTEIVPGNQRVGAECRVISDQNGAERSDIGRSYLRRARRGQLGGWIKSVEEVRSEK